MQFQEDVSLASSFFDLSQKTDLQEEQGSGSLAPGSDS